MTMADEQSSFDEEVIQFLAHKLKRAASELTLRTSFSYDLGLSSFDALQLVCDVEDQFRCSIPNHKVKELQTVGDLIGYLRALSTPIAASGA
jgi:acyl carrier protein